MYAAALWLYGLEDPSVPKAFGEQVAKKKIEHPTRWQTSVILAVLGVLECVEAKALRLLSLILAFPVVGLLLGFGQGKLSCLKFCLQQTCVKTIQGG
ncbi:hypothetical protein HPB47_018718 [Ixodes persulcatus]|uniref:Uncharacterized protein n=1 Tax=Ixodes persulcatus TaxID=34615 RepID=A0AC60QK61_IXOPE|nr:hypothetical protein HPB47_018718 [Ixodes persulcatus]